MRVLVVEDEPSYQKIFRVMLEGLGAEVVVADNGSAAWKAASARRFDVALVDIGLPDADGVSLAARLREHLRCRRVLLTSGYPPWWLQSHGFAPLPIMTKPFKLDDLVLAIGLDLPRSTAVTTGSAPRGPSAPGRWP